MAEFTLLDNKGTLNVEITTQEDYAKNKSVIYRVPDKIVYDLDQFPTDAVTLDINSFLKVSNDGDVFTYSLYKDASNPDTKLWQSDPNRLYLSPYFVMDSGIFKMN